jgi:hypothetical protein
LELIGSTQGRVELKDASRRLNRLRREVYRETPAATGLPGGSTALALWRAVTKKGFRAWCYEFGLASSLTHTVTIVEADGILRIHDALFNLTYPLGFHDVLDALRDGTPVAPKTEIRDRKIYLADLAFAPEARLSGSRRTQNASSTRLMVSAGSKFFGTSMRLLQLSQASRRHTKTSRSGVILGICAF